MATEKKSAPQRGRNKNKGRHTLQLLILVILLVIGVVLSLTVFFKIEEIRVDNIDHYTDEEIILTSGLELESNLFLADVSEVPTRLMDAFPYIEEVEVKRVLPPAVEIRVYPSMPAAALQHGDEFALITLSGKILERGLVYLPADAILVRGVDFTHRQPGEYLGSYHPIPIPQGDSPEEQALAESIALENAAAQKRAEEEQDALYAISYMIDAIDETGIQGITNLDLTDPYNMTVVYENRLLLKLGTELKLPYKLRFVDEAIGRLDPRAHGTINAESATKGANTANKILYTPAEGYHYSGVPLSALEEEQKQIDGDNVSDLQEPEGLDAEIPTETDTEIPSETDTEIPTAIDTEVPTT